MKVFTFCKVLQLFYSSFDRFIGKGYFLYELYYATLLCTLLIFPAPLYFAIILSIISLLRPETRSGMGVLPRKAIVSLLISEPVFLCYRFCVIFLPIFFLIFHRHYPNIIAGLVTPLVLHTRPSP